ncbi:hypothetical protein CTKZ_10040 [Cellulomonas algicola]|uniref:DUF86 domain-containing protein n=1 Tax=Cellulomonas algicola TaxID=2071633 RepID=A0A401UXT8_9CELL|nr:HepT-like ribonuclease domain-containing protein [Cellulomonas algicola]GCD19442.1 hypothetical protein CTKZ_10040 [Cellulomonas algicola]
MSGVDRARSDDRVAHRLADLARIGRLVAAIVAKGRDAYLDDGVDGQILRAAGREQIVEVATVVETLPAEFKAEHPAVEWVKVQRMRDLVAHHDDTVNDEFVWETLRTRIPALLDDRGLAG